VYHELLEEGRIALVAELVRRAGDANSHGAYVIAHVDLDYLTEVRKDHGEVDVVVSISHVGTTSLRLHNEVRLLDGTVAATGSCVLVAWDPVRRTKRVLSERERAALS
jgi:acyl-CoA thioester hydrolase